MNSIERDIWLNRYNIDRKKTFNLIEYIKNSDNILLDIYTLSGVKGLENLSVYLAFIYKKAENDKINFDNLYNNLNNDKEYIKNEIFDYYKLPGDNKKAAKPKIPGIKKEEKTRKKETKTHKQSKEKFRIEKHENELVTEEFIESDINEISETQYRFSGNEGTKKNYLELVSLTREHRDEEKAFELPDNNTKITISETLKEDIKTEEPETLEEITEIETETKNKNISVVFDLDDLNPEKKKSSSETDKQEPETQSKPPVKIKLTEEKNKETTQEYKDETQKPTITNKPEEEPAYIQVNTEYINYESELITRDAQLDTDFDELLMLIIDNSNNREKKENLYIKIIENSTFMEEYSAKMSFEIITNIYGIIKLAFFTATEENVDINKNYIPIFKDAILLIESLIKGVDFKMQKKVLKLIEKIKTDIVENKRQKENIEKIKKDKQELEKHLSSKYSDTTQIEKLILLKQYILEVENIFNSLDSIKGEYVSYEAVRRLSTTFIRFKEMVQISKILNIKKLAQLAESSYVFVKFIQNYRLNPFEPEIKEIFDYIIYNFKLIYLDKPTREIENFMSYLNNPVKIFDNIRKEKQIK